MLSSKLKNLLMLLLLSVSALTGCNRSRGIAIKEETRNSSSARNESDLRDEQKPPEAIETQEESRSDQSQDQKAGVPEVEPAEEGKGLTPTDEPTEKANLLKPESPMHAGDTRVDLAAQLEDLTVGYVGRYLILHLKALHQLAVFDVNQAKVVKEIPLEDDEILIAAGIERLVIVQREKRTIDCWMLTDFTRAYSKPIPHGQEIVAISMGHASLGPLLVFVDDSNGRTPVLYDPETLETFGVSVEVRGSAQWDGDFRVRAAADGSNFAITCFDKLAGNIRLTHGSSFSNGTEAVAEFYSQNFSRFARL